MPTLEQLVGDAEFVEARKLVGGVMPNWTNRNGVGDIEGLRFHCLATEVLDHAGDYTGAGQLARRVGLQCAAILRDLSDPPEPKDRSLWKQRAWAVLQLGFAVYYRRGELKDAIDLFQLVEKKLKLLEAPEYPCWGLRARLSYAIGLVHRQRHEYFEAKCAFGNAVDLSFRRIAASGKARRFYELSAARALALGLGWIYYTEGSLSTAKSLVQAARSLLAGKREGFIGSYVDVIYACISMSAQSTDAGVVGEAIQVLINAHSLFASSAHSAYQARTANELALAFLRQSRNLPAQAEQLLGEAEKYAREVETFGHGKAQIRWRCNASVVLSRIDRARGYWPRAVNSARNALDLSLRNHIRFCEIDARIALGEALLGHSDLKRLALKEAADVFEGALKNSLGENSKVQSVLHLHLARCSLRMRRLGRAIWHFERAKEAGKENENAFVRDLANEVAEQLSGARADFLVPFDTETMDDPQKELTRFKGWLTTWAVVKVTQSGTDARNTVGRAAGILDISPAQFHRWRKMAGLPPVDHRRSGGRAQTRGQS